MAAEAGKGSRPRPYSVDQKTFGSNWDAIFGKKEQTAEENKTQAAEQGIIDHSDEDQ